MARNIEIKARIESVDSIAPKAAAIAKTSPIEIAQDDTFFRCEAGRLKLRVLSVDSGELIFYRRADKRGPKESFYLRSPTSAPESLRESLSCAYGQIGRVRKQRTLFLLDRARLHLDKVEELGHFLEVEVPLAEDEAAELGVREAERIMQKLGLESAELIEGAYVDLLADGLRETRGPMKPIEGDGDSSLVAKAASLVHMCGLSLNNGNTRPARRKPGDFSSKPDPPERARE
jgi:predicted adenylyl cyclase CyaB